MRRKKILSFVLAFILMATLILPAGSPALAAGPETVTSWAGLKAAVDAALAGTTIIDISGNFNTDNSVGSINITSGKNIVIESQSSNNYTITRIVSNSSYPLFSVDIGGQLTLKNITLDGGGTLFPPPTVAMVFVNQGTFIMDGATIQNAILSSTSTCAGVQANLSTVIMKNGAKIINCKNTSGSFDYGGAMLVSGGTLKMADSCSITGCSAARGGICIDSSGTLNLTGSPNISGNTKPDGTTPCNVYLTNVGNNYVNVTEPYSPNPIGITTETAPTASSPVNVTTATNSTDLSGCFVSDNPSYVIQNSGSGTAQQVQLAIIPTVMTWADLCSAVSAAPTNGTLTTINVSANLTADTNCEISSGKNIVIQSSNGSTITRDRSLTVFNVPGSDLTLKNITLDGNSTNITATQPLVYANCKTFTMDGAIIQNVKTSFGNASAGVQFVCGTANMKNGAKITNCVNTATTNEGSGAILVGGTLNIADNCSIKNNKANGGGICVYYGGELNLSGSPDISGNTKADGTTLCNVYLVDSAGIAVTPPFNPVTRIGVTTKALPTASAPVNITTASNQDWSSKFTNDDSGYIIQNSGSGSTQQVQLTAPITVMTWADLKAAVNAAPTNGTLTTINVSANLTADTNCEISAGKNIVIQSSNGSTITRDTTLIDKSVFNVPASDLTLKNITLDGNSTNVTATSSLVYANCNTFTMDGAIIQNAKTSYYGQSPGVHFVLGTANMKNGAKITNCVNTNTAAKGCGAILVGGTLNIADNCSIKNNKENGGGIYVCFTGTLNLSGSPDISGNTKADGTTPCNVYLYKTKVVNVATPFSPTTPIGITTYFTPTSVSPVNVTTAANSTDLSGCFVSDNSNYIIKNSGSGSAQQVQLAVPTNALTVNLDGGNGATVGASYASGESVSIDAGTKSGYSFSRWTSSAGGTFASASSASTTFTMPGNATTITAIWTPSGGAGGGGYTPPAGNNTIVIVDNKDYSIGTENKNDQNTTATVDQPKLTDEIAKASDSSSVIVPVSANTNVTAQLVVKNVEDMAKKDMILTVQTGNVAYNINTSAIDTSKIKAFLGNADSKDIPFNVSIASSNAVVNGATVVVSPVEFTITAAYNGKTTNVDAFSCFVDRTIEITADQAKQITTAVVVQPDGSLRHVPTKVKVVNGKYYAVINSLTNSTYTVVWHPVEFSDVATNWAKNAINDMGSRMVVTGVGNSNYEPDRDITRAEFAAIVVRALGLAQGTGKSTFSDVDSGAWYCGYIATASAYGIIKGYSATTFGPSDTISREQAMTMISRAMEITGLNPKLADSDISVLLGKYSDATAASDYAKSGICDCLKTGIITGRSNTTLAPKDYITRAEVAVIVQRLLQKSGLI